MYWEDFATPGTKTVRKNYRRSIRGTLGTSSDDAPNLYDALRAVEALDHLLRYASGGNMALLVSVPEDAAGARSLGPVKARLYAEALKEVREARHAANERTLTKLLGPPGSVTKLEI